jgi:hypothetical protein
MNMKVFAAGQNPRTGKTAMDEFIRNAQIVSLSAARAAILSPARAPLRARWFRIRSGCAWLLSVLLLVFSSGPMLPAQTIPVPVPKMNVVVVEGEAAIHNVRDKKTTEVVVLVRDGNRKPISGASVTFTLPPDGASATFPNGARTISVVSNADGYAEARGIRPNGIQGPFAMQVQAEHEGQKAETSVTQFNMNVESSKGGSGKWIAILGVIGAAAAGGAVYALRNGGGSTAAPPVPIGIVPGPGTVGPPR